MIADLFSDASPFALRNEVKKRFNNNNSISDELIDVISFFQANPEEFAARDFDSFSLKELLNYLESSHRFYLDSWLPKISQTIYILQKQDQTKNPVITLLSAFIKRYNHELQMHIEFEEQVLFNFVNDFLKGIHKESQKQFVLEHFLTTHNDNILLYLDDLKNDLLAVDPNLKSNLSFAILFNQMDLFQRDLRIHNLIEDEVFIPKLLQSLD